MSELYDLLSKKSITPETISDAQNELVKAIESGWIDQYKVLHIHLGLKMLADLFANLKASRVFAEYVLEAAEQCKDTTFFGFRPEMTQSGRYEYKHCSLWNDINSEKKRVEEAMKNLSKVEMVTSDGEEAEMIDTVTGKPLTAAKYIPNKTSIKWVKD